MGGDEAREAALASKAWPFQEARKLLERLDGAEPAGGRVIFETGYGPSGLPHIGTFGEVARTTMVRHAFHQISDLPTRLIAFSDDMDGLRSVPGNVPNREMLEAHLGEPLARVPDPFGTHESFGHHNNARFRAFLDGFGFEYEFASAFEYYREGRFDSALRRMLECYDEVMAVMLPTLGEERQATYSPFLPVCPTTGRVLQVAIVARDVDAGTVTYRDEDARLVEVAVTGGACKLQWKPDWAMRWYALGVDYEMSGKDLIDSVRHSSRICSILGARPPEGFTYELFLDENAEKISKSRGNGLTIDEWLRYGQPESLSLYMYQSPRRAKRLYFDVIPRAVDDYLTQLGKLAGQDPAARLDNPAWHIHGGLAEVKPPPISFALLMNLAAAANAEDKAVLWGFIRRYLPQATASSEPLLERLAGHAVAYYQDFVKPAKRYRAAEAHERSGLEELLAWLEAAGAEAGAEEIQNQIYEIGKRHPFDNLRDWFRALYEVLLGQSQGPRMGSFVALYGVEETAALIRRALADEDLSEPAAKADQNTDVVSA